MGGRRTTPGRPASPPTTAAAPSAPSQPGLKRPLADLRQRPTTRWTPAGGAAVPHQPFVCLRLDLDVDGPGNSVLEANVLPVPPGKDNPARNAFLVERRLPGSELEAR